MIGLESRPHASPQLSADSDDKQRSKNEIDPSLSSYETLSLQLFDRIKDA